MQKFDIYCVSLLLVLVAIISLLIVVLMRASSGSSSNAIIFGGALSTGAVASKEYFPRSIAQWSRRVPNAADYGSLEIVPGSRVSLYSSLMPWHIASVQKMLRELFKDRAPATITDASAHIGADSVNFLRVFPQAALTAIEIDPAVSAITRRNLVYGAWAPGAPAPVVITGDGAAHIITGSPTDMLYIDPPWGGASANERRHNYSDQHMRLGDKALPELVAVALARGFGTVIVKLPRESDPHAFIKAVELGRATAAANFDCRAHAICDARQGDNKRCVRSYWLVSCRMAP
jgi:hypothetical protein